MIADDAPCHAHVYFSADQRPAAEALRDAFLRLAEGGQEPQILYVGQMTRGKAGPHPIPQYEIHFRGSALAAVVARIEGSGLRALVHPLTDDDLADHTTLGQWIGTPLELDVTVLDPPGMNKGIPRFGKRDL